MKKTRFSEEQMVTILREADEKPVPEVAKKHGVSAQTIYGWRKHFGTLEPADIKRLRQLEQENARLSKKTRLTLLDGWLRSRRTDCTFVKSRSSIRCQFGQDLTTSTAFPAVGSPTRFA
jgi:putative transposase